MSFHGGFQSASPPSDEWRLSSFSHSQVELEAEEMEGRSPPSLTGGRQQMDLRRKTSVAGCF